MKPGQQAAEVGRQAAAVVAAVAEVPQQSAYSEQHTRLLFILHGGIGFGCCLRRLPPRRAEGALGAACHPARAQERAAIAATRPECDRTPVHRDHMRPLPSRHPASSSRPQLPGCNEARQSSPAVPHVANCYKPRYGSIKQRVGWENRGLLQTSEVQAGQKEWRSTQVGR